jgi:hypothetical protein
MKNKSIVKRPLNKYPSGWNRKKIQELAEHYENQSEDEAVAEIEAAFKAPDQAVVFVPRSLVPQIRKLVAAHAGRK